MTRILIIEDEVIIRKELRRLLVRRGYEVEEAGSIREALEDHPPQRFDLVLADLRLPGALGTDIIGPSQHVPVVIMTSYASVKSAVEAMKLGARDYITKPFDHDELVQVLERVLAKRVPSEDKGATTGRALETAVGAGASPVQMSTGASGGTDGAAPGTSRPLVGNAPLQSDLLEGIIGASPLMKEVFVRIRKVAPTASTVLVSGESGTGKELVARAVHRLSPRASGPLVAINCAAIPEGLIESELFGYEKGAFTGAISARAGVIEAAHQGTLFLDELGELPLSAQARLLRVLQEAEVRRLGGAQNRKVDVRLIGATHRNLKQLCREGRFREDLYFRLNVLEIHLPPLRERGDDILELTQTFLTRACERHQKPRRYLPGQTQAAIRTHSWPGNVRELANTVERAVILFDEEVLLPSHLGLEVSQTLLAAQSPGGQILPGPEGTPKGWEMGGMAVTQAPVAGPGEGAGGLSLEAYFRQFVQEHQEQLTETELARQLGISRKALWERRLRLNLPRPTKR